MRYSDSDSREIRGARRAGVPPAPAVASRPAVVSVQPSQRQPGNPRRDGKSCPFPGNPRRARTRVGSRQDARSPESIAWRGTRPRNEPPDTGIYTPASAWYFPRSFPRPPRAQVAQLVEQRTENPRVGGSIPSLGTTFNPSKINGLGSRVLDMCSIRVVRPTIRENCDAYSVPASPEVLPAQGATVSAMLLPHPS